jgi:hypothetical protein
VATKIGRKLGRQGRKKKEEEEEEEDALVANRSKEARCL